MGKKFQEKIKAISVLHFVYLSLLTFCVLNFIICLSGEHPRFKTFLSNIPASIALATSCVVFIFCVWLAISFCFEEDKKTSLQSSSIVLSPVLLYFLWSPQVAGFWELTPTVIVITTGICFFVILKAQKNISMITTLTQKIILAVIIIAYFAFFAYSASQQVINFSFFNSKDFAIYNQTFWNTIHGRFFENSAYGSNFACHNTWFYLLLLPFYYIFPHPLTLLVLKILLLALSAIPFYLISKNVLKDISVLPLVAAYLLYPFLVYQNFNPPHEIGYAPFFLLFTYYFYMKNKFWPFMLFLVLSLSIKEHISLIAIMFGVYSIFSKKGFKWKLAPAILGIIWGVFSLEVLYHFQKAYQSNPNAAWFITSLRTKFLAGENGLFVSLKEFFAVANIGNWYNIKSFLAISLMPAGLVLPLLSPVILLGLPEFVINILSDRPAMLSANMHYNIVVSCFVLISTVKGIKKICAFQPIKKIVTQPIIAHLLLSILILSSTLMNSHIWLDLTRYKNDAAYNKSIKQALSLIPKDAYISVPSNIAIYASSRKKYSIIGQGEYGDYILIDKNNADLISQKEIRSKYSVIFNLEGIKVLQKKNQ